MSRKPSMNPFRNRELASGLIAVMVITIPMAIVARQVVLYNAERAKGVVLDRGEWKCTAFVAEPPEYAERCGQWTAKEMGR